MTTKKTYASRLGILALVLALTSTCLLGGTMAKYTTEVTGDGTATVAKWSFKANGETSTMADVDLANTTYSNVASKTIAPGTVGSFDVKIDAKGSQTAIEYAISFSNVNNKPTNLKFYSDNARTQEITNLADHVGLKGTIALADVDTELTKTIYWKWVDDEANADDDMAKAQAAEKVTFKITVTGTQQTPAIS